MDRTSVTFNFSPFIPKKLQEFSSQQEQDGHLEFVRVEVPTKWCVSPVFLPQYETHCKYYCIISCWPIMLTCMSKLLLHGRVHPCGSLSCNHLLPVRMPPSGFSQDSSQSPPALTWTRPRRRTHTFLPAIFHTWVWLHCCQHTQPKASISLLFFCLCIRALNAPPVSKRKRGGRGS